MNYTDIVFTDHAIVKLKERGISKNDAFETVLHPDQNSSGKKKGTRELRKKFDEFEITAICRENNKQEWVILSVWRNPPLPGTPDAKQKTQWKKYNKAGVWDKIWFSIKQQIGF